MGVVNFKFKFPPRGEPATRSVGNLPTHPSGRHPNRRSTPSHATRDRWPESLKTPADMPVSGWTQVLPLPTRSALHRWALHTYRQWVKGGGRREWLPMSLQLQRVALKARFLFAVSR